MNINHESSDNSIFEIESTIGSEYRKIEQQFCLVGWMDLVLQNFATLGFIKVWIMISGFALIPK
jgi:hypothetical protein